MVNTMAARFQALSHTVVQAHRAAPRKPPRAPKMSCRGPVAICQATFWLGPPVMATLEKMVYSVMATMSSKEAAATTRAGMPAQLWLEERVLLRGMVHSVMLVSLKEAANYCCSVSLCLSWHSECRHAMQGGTCNH